MCCVCVVFKLSEGGLPYGSLVSHCLFPVLFFEGGSQYIWLRNHRRILLSFV